VATNHKVQEHLKLTADQKKKISAVLESIVQDDGQGHRMIMWSGDTDMKQIDKDIAAVFNEEQTKRFGELYLQFVGYTALSIKEYAEKLAVTDDQKKKLDDVWDERKSAMQQLIDTNSGGGSIHFEKSDLDKIKANMNKKIEGILAKDQLDKWKTWLGEKFDFEKDGG